ncbi:MAG: adenine deaminase [Actinobacteria bacterium]|nr:adenine deaminase [Actinomycetota bacterium]
MREAESVKLVEAEALSRERAAEVAVGRAAADLVLRGGRVVDVYTRRLVRADVAIAGDRIAAVGEVAQTIGDATEAVDCDGFFVLPGFVEPHLHVGSSGLTIERLAEVLVARGTVAMSTCLYEAAVVLGLPAVEELLDRSPGTGLDVLLSPFGGALGMGPLGASRMGPEELRTLVEDERTVELREWNYPSSKLPGSRELWLEAMRRNIVVGGHLEGLRGPLLQGSVALGVCSDHETATAEEAAEKVAAGVIVQIREGSGARDLRAVLPAITEHGLDAGCFAFSTDEQELDSLVEEGHIDRKLRMAVREGLGPIDAVRMATLGAARSIGVERNYGAVAPGRVASLAVVEDLAEFTLRLVVSRGQVAAENGEYLLARSERPYPAPWSETIHLERELEAEDFLIDHPGGTLRVIGVTPGSLATAELIEEVELEDGRLPAGSEGVAKLAVADRHEASGRIGLGLIRGLEITGGAVATTINPGVSNLMVIGDDEDAMALAANRVRALGGGTVVASADRVVAELALPLLGLFSHRPVAEVATGSEQVARALRETLGCPHAGILTNAGFACLASVIPALKLCEHGLVRVGHLDPPQPVELALDGAFTAPAQAATTTLD